jgi:2-C-methyl-D-erythritol 2,4-cyclodiphosphate synthase
MECRTGIGYDIHRLIEGRKLFLGGVEIPYIKGLLGHSDGDVLLHAVCDAFLGALGEGDIGERFPDTDPQYEGISSGKLVQNVASLLKEKNFIVNNIDSVIVAQEPNLSPFKKGIRQSIARLLEIPEDKVNIKAKTNEGLDSIGQKEAIAAYVTVAINKGV